MTKTIILSLPCDLPSCEYLVKVQAEQTSEEVQHPDNNVKEFEYHYECDIISVESVFFGASLGITPYYSLPESVKNDLEGFVSDNVSEAWDKQ